VFCGLKDIVSYGRLNVVFLQTVAKEVKGADLVLPPSGKWVKNFVAFVALWTLWFISTKLYEESKILIVRESIKGRVVI
jgi:hypothetical protein